MKSVDCKLLKLEGLEEIKKQIKGQKVSLRIIQVEGDSASDLYVKNKKKAANQIGIDIDHILLKQDVTNKQVIEIIDSLNKDENVNGIMVQLPLPNHLDEDLIINSITPIKDVDGLTTENLGRIVTNEEALRPCTSEGVMTVLDKCIGLENLQGKTATIIGRTTLVGLPLIHMLLSYDATPIVCHSKTKNLENHTKNADIIITAAGAKTPFINSEMIKENSIILDVSTVVGEDGKLHGDVIYNDVIDKAGYVSPVPGGLGQLTVLELMKNTYKAKQMQDKQKNKQQENNPKQLKLKF